MESPEPETVPPPSGAHESRPETTGPIRLYTAAHGISSAGTWMQKTAVGWLAWDLTHSAAWVGAVALMDLVALLWVAPLAGAVADRRSPYLLFRNTQRMSVLIALTLCVLDATGVMTIGFLMAITLVESTINGFNAPARMTTINYLSPAGGISRAIAMNSVAVALARSAGPATAGLLLAAGGAAAVFALNAASYFAMLLVLWRLRALIDHPPAPRATPFVEDITAGFSYIARTPGIALVITMAVIFAVLARPFADLLPAFAGAVFEGGPQTLGALLTTQGLGALAGALLMMSRRGPKASQALMFRTGVAMTACLVLFCLMRDLRLALPVMLAIGMFHVMCNITLQSLAQERADPAFRGRVLSVYSLLFRTGPAGGAFLIGVAAPVLGLQLLVGAVAAVACGLFACLWRRHRPVLLQG